MAFRWKDFLHRGPERIDFDRVFLREMPVAELGVTVLYVLVAGVWCVFSDDAFDWLLGVPMDSPGLQTLKGINFVVITGLLLYMVLRRSFRNRRLAEEVSRINQERFEAVALATTDAIWDWNLDTNTVWWSNSIEKLFGYAHADVSTKVDWWLDRLHPEDKDRVLESIRRVADGAGPTWAGHYRFRCQDGSYSVVLDRGYIVRDAAGKPLRVVGGMSDITERRRAEEALEASRRQLRALSTRLQSVREEERATVAREIHDELGQALTALKINLDWLERKMGERTNDPGLNPMLDRVVESTQMTESAIGSVQRIATELRPSVLDTLGLSIALQQEAQRFQQRTGTTCELEMPSEPLDVPPGVATTIFRIFQEALTNVARHAQAKQVRVALRLDQDSLTLEVEDDGIGIRPNALDDSKSLGLLGMRERALALEGEVAVTPVHPRGTRVIVRLPRVTSGQTAVPEKV